MFFVGPVTPDGRASRRKHLAGHLRRKTFEKGIKTPLISLLWVIKPSLCTAVALSSKGQLELIRSCVSYPRKRARWARWPGRRRWALGGKLYGPALSHFIYPLLLRASIARRWLSASSYLLLGVDVGGELACAFSFSTSFASFYILSSFRLLFFFLPLAHQINLPSSFFSRCHIISCFFSAFAYTPLLLSHFFLVFFLFTPLFIFLFHQINPPSPFFFICHFFFLLLLLSL